MISANRVAIVTGGTSGIGLATARELVARGARVVVAGRDLERGQRAVVELAAVAQRRIDQVGEQGASPDEDRVQFVAADVSRADDAARIVDAAVSRWGRLDWAVNAAAGGDYLPAPTADITESDWQRMIAVALTGVWLCMRSELTAMVANGAGAIVNVSSVNGLSGTPMAAAYCAAKHAVHGLTKTAAIEYAPRGVRVNVVCPGAHRTPMLEGVFAKVAPGHPAKAEGMYNALIPAGRIGDPSECARAIAWLLSDEASYVSGAVLAVDGGLSAH